MTGKDDNHLMRLEALSAERTANAEAYLAMLERHGQVASRADVTYRCPNRRHCTLLRAYATAQGVVVHVSRYKLSEQVNAASSTEDGRAKNTEDGANHWKAHTFYVDDALNVSLNCDHVRALVIGRDRIEREASSRQGDVILSDADHEVPPPAGVAVWRHAAD